MIPILSAAKWYVLKTPESLHALPVVARSKNFSIVTAILASKIKLKPTSALSLLIVVTIWQEHAANHNGLKHFAINHMWFICLLPISLRWALHVSIKFRRAGL